MTNDNVVQLDEQRDRKDPNRELQRRFMRVTGLDQRDDDNRHLVDTLRR